jgi:hypothetical protein
MEGFCCERPSTYWFANEWANALSTSSDLYLFLRYYEAALIFSRVIRQQWR